MRVIMIAGEPADKLVSDLIANCEFLKLDVSICEVDKNSDFALSKLLYMPAEESNREDKEK